MILKGTFISENEPKKGDFENPKVIYCDFSTKSDPTQYNFCNSTNPWKHKISTIWGTPVHMIKKVTFLARS